ncbi:MAG: MBL fold metallo-hydrolase [Bacteroidota bacterium]
MKVTLRMLGSGTSQGVPVIGCRCETCMSLDARDTRLRPSVLFTIGKTTILVDTSSDFRQQMLRNSVNRIDAVLYTHHHFDHIGGFDDLRQFNYLQNAAMRVYGLSETLQELRKTFRYAFGEAMQIGGGVPSVILSAVAGGTTFSIDSVAVTAIPVMHGMMPIIGYRIGNVAYITDTNYIPESSYALLEGLDVLVLDALRHQEHPTHFSLRESVDAAGRIGARRTYFTHIAHNIMHGRDNDLLPENMEFSYDGLVITSDRSSHD